MPHFFFFLRHLSSSPSFFALFFFLWDILWCMQHDVRQATKFVDTLHFSIRPFSLASAMYCNVGAERLQTTEGSDTTHSHRDSGSVFSLMMWASAGVLLRAKAKSTVFVLHSEVLKKKRRRSWKLGEFFSVRYIRSFRPFYFLSFSSPLRVRHVFMFSSFLFSRSSLQWYLLSFIYLPNLHLSSFHLHSFFKDRLLCFPPPSHSLTCMKWSFIPLSQLTEQ